MQRLGHAKIVFWLHRPAKVLFVSVFVAADVQARLFVLKEFVGRKLFVGGLFDDWWAAHGSETMDHETVALAPAFDVAGHIREPHQFSDLFV